MKLAAATLMTICFSALPARAASWRPVATASLLTAAEASLALDALQTLDIKNEWRNTNDGSHIHALRETNILLGERPSDAKIVAYFSGAAVATAAVTYALPKGYRWIAPVAVLLVEVPLIVNNARLGCTIRF